MITSAQRLLFLRFTGLLANGFLLTAGTVLFAFGMLEVFQMVAGIALVITWLFVRPATARLVAADEYDSYRMGEKVTPTGAECEGTEAGITVERYTRLRAALVRSRIRRRLDVRRDRFDGAQAILTTLVWMSYLGFLSSVIAAAA